MLTPLLFLNDLELWMFAMVADVLQNLQQQDISSMNDYIGQLWSNISEIFSVKG